MRHVFRYDRAITPLQAIFFPRSAYSGRLYGPTITQDSLISPKKSMVETRGIESGPYRFWTQQTKKQCIVKRNECRNFISSTARGILSCTRLLRLVAICLSVYQYVSSLWGLQRYFLVWKQGRKIENKRLEQRYE